MYVCYIRNVAVGNTKKVRTKSLDLHSHGILIKNKTTLVDSVNKIQYTDSQIADKTLHLGLLMIVWCIFTDNLKTFVLARYLQFIFSVVL